MLQTPQQPPPQINQQAAQQAHNAAVAERELAKRRARKPTDKNLPADIESTVPQAQLYQSLREMERRYDAAIMRKRLDIQDAVNRNVKNQKTMRIFISNTAKDQPWQMSDRPLDENAFDFDSGQIPTFRVKIEGRLLEDDAFSSPDTTNPDSDLFPTPPAPAPQRKFSDFFKSIIISLDRPKDLHPDGNTIEWRKPSPNTQPATSALGQTGPTSFDAFEFTRKGDENLTCTVKLILDETPDRFRLSPPLAQLLDTTEDTRAGIVMKLWEYVRRHNLQDPEERRTINCDAPMKAIFNLERLYFPQIPELTLSHILPVEPVEIKYTIRTDVPAHFSQEVYDVVVNVDDPIRARMGAVVASPTYAQALGEILKLDDQTAVLCQAVAHSKAKRDFWRAFSEEPAGFVKRWVSSQKRDMETLMGEIEKVEESEERSAVWKDKINESVYLLLARQGRQAL